MGASNPGQAAVQAESFARRALTGSHKRKKRYQHKAAVAGDAIYRRFQVAPTKWRAKHLLYFFREYLADKSPSTKYQYWLAVRAALLGLNRYHDLEPHLRGPWCNPKGRESAGTGRRKPKLKRQ